ncbi:MAG: DUF1553 domain-containing protein [Planctomycetaceae bacterium]|nr:DUF1553 domain-containing protein [Planctomycetaceae bacterium]
MAMLPLVVLLLGWLFPSTAGSAEPAAPSFDQDVMAILSRTGCNQGTCHGSAGGKGGLKLSLRGQDADADFVTLTRRLGSRRVNLVRPEESLLLQKPLMLVPHEGGRRFEEQSDEFRILRDWIANGLPDDPAGSPAVIGLSVRPQTITIEAGSAPIRLHAEAQLGDGTQRDVTGLAVFDSSSVKIGVSRDGVVSAETSGLTTVTVRYLHLQEPVRVEIVASRPDFTFEAPTAQNFIDELVFAQLRRLCINPSRVCDDVTFLRRVWLDLTGQLPPKDDALSFVSSKAPDKRQHLIDQLLQSEAFIDQQTMRWAELLRAEEKTLDETGLKVYHNWIRDCVASNRPVNQMAADLLAARGSTYKVPATNFYRALRTYEERAESTAQLFLGVRLTCAKCHNHPFDRWTQDDYYGWSNFFARIDYEIIENKRRDKNDKHEFVGEQIVKIKADGEVTNGRTGQPADLRYLGESETEPHETAEHDRLQLLADWISSPNNRRFAAAQTNRIWFQLTGRGIVDPIDDFRATNPPVNPELLEALTDEFVRSGFDTRHLMKLILSSHTYQLSAETNPTNVDDDQCFSHVTPSRLTAEQTLDAVAAVLGVSIPFGGHKPGTRATQLVGVRNGEFRYAQPEAGDDFLKLFGRPNRLQSCECERSNDPSLAQTFELVSGELVTTLIHNQSSRVNSALSSDQTPEEFLTELWLTALSRRPTAEEQQRLTDFIRSRNDPKAAMQDVVWAVLNSNEFLLRR